MKSGTTETVKFKKLCRRLKLSRWQCVGLLESLWLFTAQNAPQGNIGRFSNEDIAISLEWDGCEDDLINMLTECGWIDKADNEHRLVIHDWDEHAPTYIKGNLSKSGRKFITKDGTKEPSKKRTKDIPKDDTKEPPKDGSGEGTTKPNLFKPNQVNSPHSSEGADALTDEEKILEIYPTRKTAGEREATLAAIREAIGADGFELVRDKTTLFARYFSCWESAKMRFASSALKFFMEREYRTPDSKNQNCDPEKLSRLQAQMSHEREAQERAELADKMAAKLEPFHGLMIAYQDDLAASDPVKRHTLMLEFIDNVNRKKPCREISNYLDEWAQMELKKCA